MSVARANFAGLSTLLVDSDHFTRSIVAEILRGFGIPTPVILESGAAAKEHFIHHSVDLLICEAVLPDMASPELIRWLRRRSDKIRFTPVIVITGYTQLKTVTAARDSGASVVVKKLVSPQVLFDRICSAARDPRPFVEVRNYAGPDRRFKKCAPPNGQARRESDFEPEESNSELDEQISARNQKIAART